MAKTNITEIKNSIKGLSDESSLRSLREYADSCLQKIKEQKAAASIDKIAKKYKDKYLLLYGRHYTRLASIVNPAEFTIVHVEDIDYAGATHFRCKAKIIRAAQGDKFSAEGFLVDKYAGFKLEVKTDHQHNIDYGDIDEIITKEKATEMINEFKKKVCSNCDNWEE